MEPCFKNWGVFALALLVSPSAARGETSQPVRLRYTAPAGCPSAAEFEESLKRRAYGGLRTTKDEEATRLIIVELARRDAGYWGSIAFRGVDGTSQARSVAADRCEDVTAVLALVAALALEGALAEGDDSPRSGSTSSEGARDTPKGASSDAVAPADPLVRADDEADGPAPLAPRESGAPPALRLSQGAVGARASYGALPGFAIGPDVALGLELVGSPYS